MSELMHIRVARAPQKRIVEHDVKIVLSYSLEFW
jgi:hypothetical protein